MCHGTPAGHDRPLHSNLLEPAGTFKRKLPSSPGASAEGEEAGLLPGSGSHFVCGLLDSSAPDELSSALSWASSCHTGMPLYRQVMVLFEILTELVVFHIHIKRFLHLNYALITYQQ